MTTILEVCVESGENLQPKTKVNPLCLIHLRFDGQREPEQEKTTQYQLNKNTPEWQQTFQFRVPSGKNGALVFTVDNHLHNGRHKPLGTAEMRLQDIFQAVRSAPGGRYQRRLDVFHDKKASFAIYVAFRIQESAPTPICLPYPVVAQRTPVQHECAPVPVYSPSIRNPYAPQSMYPQQQQYYAAPAPMYPYVPSGPMYYPQQSAYPANDRTPTPLIYQQPPPPSPQWPPQSPQWSAQPPNPWGYYPQ